MSLHRHVVAEPTALLRRRHRPDQPDPPELARTRPNLPYPPYPPYPPYLPTRPRKTLSGVQRRAAQCGNSARRSDRERERLLVHLPDLGSPTP